MIKLIELAVAILIFVWLLGQLRRPSGPLGRVLAWSMNHSHSALTQWALQQVPIRKTDTILDVGWRGGRTVQRLAALAPEGSVDGIDYSAASVAASRQTNAREIEAGRVRIQLGSVAALPFPDRHFDVVTAAETHYYWPDLPASTREVLRVMKSGGTFAIIAETHRGGVLGALYAVPMLLLRAAFLTDGEHRELLAQAGFGEVATFHAPGKNWICAVGRRPSAPGGETP